MDTRVLSLPMRPSSLPLWSGIFVAAALIAAQALVVYPRRGRRASRGATVRI
jgi:hypothetical protein